MYSVSHTLLCLKVINSENTVHSASLTTVPFNNESTASSSAPQTWTALFDVLVMYDLDIYFLIKLNINITHTIITRTVSFQLCTL